MRHSRRDSVQPAIVEALRAFAAHWRGQVAVVRSAAEALSLFGVVR